MRVSSSRISGWTKVGDIDWCCPYCGERDGISASKIGTWEIEDSHRCCYCDKEHGLDIRDPQVRTWKLE